MTHFKLPILNQYGFNLTELVHKNELTDQFEPHAQYDDHHMLRLLQVTSRRNKNSLILQTDSLQIVWQYVLNFAVKLASRDVPERLFDTELYVMYLMPLMNLETSSDVLVKLREETAPSANAECGVIVYFCDSGYVMSNRPAICRTLTINIARGETRSILSMSNRQHKQLVEPDFHLSRKAETIRLG